MAKGESRLLVLVFGPTITNNPNPTWRVAKALEGAYYVEMLSADPDEAKWQMTDVVVATNPTHILILATAGFYSEAVEVEMIATRGVSQLPATWTPKIPYAFNSWKIADHWPLKEVFYHALMKNILGRTNLKIAFLHIPRSCDQNTAHVVSETIRRELK